MMALNNKKRFPYWSTWENKLLDIVLAVITVLYQSEYSTLYILVSRIAFYAAIPIGLPSLSFNLLLTIVSSGPS